MNEQTCGRKKRKKGCPSEIKKGRPAKRVPSGKKRRKGKEEKQSGTEN